MKRKKQSEKERERKREGKSKRYTSGGGERKIKRDKKKA